ncbi:EamA family transporter, partial [Kitasatospora indigofera]
ILVFVHHPPSLRALEYAAATGVLSSAVPFLVDMLALRKVPTQFFGVFMSVHPVMAALVGQAVLDQRLPVADWVAIAAIVVVNTVGALVPATKTARPNRSDDKDGRAV